jgi:hypothetical protein
VAPARAALLIEPASHAGAIKTDRDGHHCARRLSAVTTNGKPNDASCNDSRSEATEHLFWEVWIHLTPS